MSLPNDFSVYNRLRSVLTSNQLESTKQLLQAGTLQVESQSELKTLNFVVKMLKMRCKPTENEVLIRRQKAPTNLAFLFVFRSFSPLS